MAMLVAEIDAAISLAYGYIQQLELSCSLSDMKILPSICRLGRLSMCSLLTSKVAVPFSIQMEVFKAVPLAICLHA